MPASSINISIPGPYDVYVIGDRKNLGVEFAAPEMPLTTVEVDALASQLRTAASRIRSLTKKKWTWGDTR